MNIIVFYYEKLIDYNFQDKNELSKLFSSSNVQFSKFISWQIVLKKLPYHYTDDRDSNAESLSESE